MCAFLTRWVIFFYVSSGIRGTIIFLRDSFGIAVRIVPEHDLPPFIATVEKVEEQLSDLGDGNPVPDTIWFGYVQGFEEEWGCFSQAEIESLRPKTWEIPKKNLPYSGRRN